MLRQSLAGLRVLLVLTVVFGVVYPLAITLIAQAPGLKDKANGSLVSHDGKVVGSSLIGQSFSDSKGNPLVQYFQPRPSAAGDGYDPTATSASNLGPESVEDAKDKPSLLTQVCSRSAAVGQLEGVDGSRPYCADGVGAVLRVFYSEPAYRGSITKVISVNQACPAKPFLASYRGSTVVCGHPGADYARGKLVLIRGDAPSHPAVPADAVTASGSGLDPQITPAYAKIQIARVAKARGITTAQVRALVEDNTTGRALGFIGEPTVNVLELNLALDKKYPFRK